MIYLCKAWNRIQFIDSYLLIMKIISKLHNWKYHCTGTWLGLNKVDSRGVGSRQLFFFYYWMQNGAFSGHLRVSKKAWPGTILITWTNKVCSKSTLLALADTNTDQIPIVSWAMRAKILLVLHSVTNYCGTNLFFYDINDLILNISWSIFLPATSIPL